MQRLRVWHQLAKLGAERRRYQLLLLLVLHSYFDCRLLNRESDTETETYTYVNSEA